MPSTMYPVTSLCTLGSSRSQDYIIVTRSDRGSRMSALGRTNHSLRVMRLYRSGLKNLQNWTVHRDLFIDQAYILRARFDANKHVTTSAQIEKILLAGEAELIEYTHPAPYKSKFPCPPTCMSSSYRTLHPHGPSPQPPACIAQAPEPRNTFVPPYRCCPSCRTHPRCVLCT